MESHIGRLRQALVDAIDAKTKLLNLPEQLAQFDRAVTMVVESLKGGGRLFIAGNGGSAADAQHLAAEFVSKLNQPRGPLPAEALTVDSSVLTAIGNDYGFEEIFARQLAAKATSRDVFLAISTSGASKNIIQALQTCSKLQVPSILFTGYSGGAAGALADACIITPGQTTSTIQEIHIVLCHALCWCVECALLAENADKESAFTWQRPEASA